MFVPKLIYSDITFNTQAGTISGKIGHCGCGNGKWALGIMDENEQGQPGQVFRLICTECGNMYGFTLRQTDLN